MVSEHLPRLVPHCASLLAKGRIGESLNPSTSGERTPPAGLGRRAATLLLRGVSGHPTEGLRADTDISSLFLTPKGLPLLLERCGLELHCMESPRLTFNRFGQSGGLKLPQRLSCRDQRDQGNFRETAIGTLVLFPFWF